ncbi:MAG: hypothetical protein ABIW49_05860 [Knoellia sp.]
MPSAEQGTTNARIVMLLAIACVAGVMVAILGWILGAAPLSAVEPNAQFVDCGAALFGRPDPLPHPDCAGAYLPLPFFSVSLMLSGAIGALACIDLLIRRPSSLLTRSPAPAVAQRV